MTQVFVDMDGVLFDFDSGYHAAFGIKPDKASDNVDWELVRAYPNFYSGLPPMRDMHELWDYVSRFRPAPVILTGIPRNVPEAASNKIACVRKHLGNVEVRCCRSSEKFLHARPGDLLIDDWEKYRRLWEGVRGRWITHKSARDSIEKMNALGIVP